MNEVSARKLILTDFAGAITESSGSGSDSGAAGRFVFGCFVFWGFFCGVGSGSGPEAVTERSPDSGSSGSSKTVGAVAGAGVGVFRTILGRFFVFDALESGMALGFETILILLRVFWRSCDGPATATWLARSSPVRVPFLARVEGRLSGDSSLRGGSCLFGAISVQANLTRRHGLIGDPGFFNIEGLTAGIKTARNQHKIRGVAVCMGVLLFYSNYRSSFSHKSVWRKVGRGFGA